MSELLQHSVIALLIASGFLGLLVGSFLNVVIYRLPLIIMAEWPENESGHTDQTVTLSHPRSFCPHCQHTIAWYDNLPLLSFLLLAGKCRKCRAKISRRYPLVEGLTACVSVICAWYFGYSLALIAALILSWGLIAQSFIDLEHFILPDQINLPLLWIGLLLSISGIFTNSHDSILGAAAGYLSLWSIYHLFKFLTGKEGMGYGDFKLLALLGAWLGWQQLPIIIMLSSLIGSVFGIILILHKRSGLNTPIPFGPYLAGSGWMALVFGDELNAWYQSLLVL